MKNFLILFSLLALVLSTKQVQAQSSEQTACEESSGTWRQFTNGCADGCTFLRNPNMYCNTIVAYSCDCGPNACWNGSSCESNTTEFNKIDLNKDGQVNIIDYSVFKNLFRENNNQADLNEDGRVNILDYTIFKNLFKQKP